MDRTQMELPNLSDLKHQGIGITIFCGDKTCGRMAQYVPIDQALERFGPVSLRELEGKIYCQTCRDAGRPGRVTVRPSSLDYSDQRHGLPAGTTERRQAERAIVEARDGRVPPRPWW